MRYVGIDIAKKNHVAAVLDDEGNVVKDAFSFANSSPGFARLLMQLGSAGIDCDECLVGMEATGHYWVALFDFLTSYGFEVVVINPLQTDAFRRVDTVRQTKTDPIDARLIAELLRVKKFEPSALGDETCDSLKHLTRFRMSMIVDCTTLKNKATAILDRIFPEYTDVFVNPYGPTSRSVLKRCATPRQVIKTGINRLTRIIDVASYGRCGRDKASELILTARRSIGVSFSSDALAMELRMIIERIDYLENLVKSLDGEISQLLKETPGKWLTTVPGIGSTLAAQIAGEIGDAHRFDSPKKLVAFAGMDATKYQSGTRDDAGHMSKHGSSQLRYALIQAADGARRCSAYFGDYYEKKIAEGAHYYHAISCVARKLAGVVLALMKEERPWQDTPPANHLPGHLLMAETQPSATAG